MPDIFDENGDVIAVMRLSSKQLGMLEAGEEITVAYHTPQLLRGLLGDRGGAFTLSKKVGRITAENPATVKEYASLQKAIAGSK